MGHHHHKRGSNCSHGWWATSDADGHHHHKLGHDCEHNQWSTDTQGGHHHHKRGGDCVEHHQWATGEDVASRGLAAEEHADADQRSFDELETAEQP